MIVLTGASSGIGAAAAVALTRKGHPVLAIGRNRRRLDRVARRMRAVAPSGCAVPAPLAADLSEMAGVQAVAGAVHADPTPLSALALNAGIETATRQLNGAGVEMTFAVNHIAPVYLTHLLWERLHRDRARIVITASSNHADGEIDLDDLSMERGWSTRRAYDASKLANVLFAHALRARTDLPVSAFHPGSITTALNRESRTYWLDRFIELFIYHQPAKGAETLVFLASVPEAAANVAPYYVDRVPAPLGGRGGDLELAERLMEKSAEMLGIHFPPPCRPVSP